MSIQPQDAEKIAEKATMVPIKDIARKFGIKSKHIELYGNYKAKVSLDALKGRKSHTKNKYIFVTAITPTPYGEGKTVTTIGLSMAFNKLNKKSIACIRQSSLGPIFGAKGSASGGGYAQVLPMEDVNLHLTGDSHAVTAANNLCAAFLDNMIFRGNPLDVDIANLNWDRVEGVSDRFLRNVTVGMGTKKDGIPTKTSFGITESSELMAILSLSENLGDLRARIGRIVVGYTKKNRPVTTENIKVAGAMAALLKDAIKPNLLQTLEKTPCFIHTGPFGNIAHGNSSIIADKIALGRADYVVTEGGFGADVGAEKFFNIKCRTSGLKPDVCVLVCSIRALKAQSGDYDVTASKPIDSYISRENVSAVERGCSNLDKQIENIKCFGVPVVVCINRFNTDTEKEINAVKRCAISSGADRVAVSEAWSMGGAGAIELAKTVQDAIKNCPSKFRFLYPVDMSIKEKISRIAKTIYGAKEISYSETALKKIALLRKLKFHALPICMGKTHLSLSHDSKRKGRPRGFKLPVNDLHLAAGAGFIYVQCGDIKTMPGLPLNPRGKRIDIDKQGNITGLI
ncbi:MAG: formate--tetrahydrofolate ligase [Candidatus Omnitrophica bacterium]|nr:formate--tetrahydrofolate ligase [Candidatus Omnitrophota bacterium]